MTTSRVCFRGSVALAVGVGVAQGQFLPGSFLGSAVQAAAPHTVIQTPAGTSPLQPQGFAQPAEKSGELGDPESGNQNFQIIHAGNYGQDGQEVSLGGGVEFLFRGYRVSGDRARGNLQTKIFTVEGSVHILGKDAVVTGQEVTVNFDNRTYRAVGGESELRPSLVGGGLLDDLYVKAGESYGSQNEIWANAADLTTCNLPDPHYDILADRADVRPGRRVILRHAKIRLFGHVLLDIPFVVIPLDDRTFRYLPVVGQDPVEGYFVKFRWGVPLKGNNDLDVRTDYMSKLGEGLGADYRYFNRSINGYASLYTVPQIGELVLANNHRQKFSFGSFSFDNDYEKNNYLTAPGSTTLNTRAQLVIPERRGDSDRFSFSRNANESAGFSSANETISLDDSRRFGSGIQSTVDVNWLTTNSKFGQGTPPSSNEEVDVRFKATNQLKKGDLDLEYIRTIPVGKSAGFASGSDRTPYIDFSSDASRLFGTKAAEELPFRTDLSFGEFTDSFSNSGAQIGRYNFNFDFNRPDRSSGRVHNDINGLFHQGVYSDDTAQYVLGLNDQLAYKLGSDTAVNLRYNYLKPEGYSPLSIDSNGKMNLLTGDFSVRPTRPLLVAVQSGFDFNQTKVGNVGWQQVGVRSEFTPSKFFLWRTLSTYDTFIGEWSNVQMDFSYKRGTTFYGLGTRYDGIQKAWSNANLFINGLQWGKTKMTAILNYNGYTKQFDTEQFAFTYDLHCAEAIIQLTQNNYGFNPGRTVAFFLRLKALPYELPFGFGNSGQPLGFGTGNGY